MPTEIYVIVISNVFNSNKMQYYHWPLHCLHRCDALCLFQTGFQVTRRPSYCSVVHVLPKFFLPYQNKPASFFSLFGKFETNCFCNILPLPSSLHHNLGVIEAIFLCKPCWLVSQELVFGKKIRTWVRRFALSGYRQWHLHVPGMILESIQALKNFSMPI